MARARTIWKVVLALCAVLVALAIGMAVYTDHVMRTTSEARGARLRAALASHRDEFLKDQRLLASLPMFTPRSGTRDAGPLIGPRVHWMVAAGKANSASVPGVTLDPGLNGKLGDDWMHAAPVLWSGVDFGWMARLAEYDYWDADRNAVAPDDDSWSDTEPDTMDLVAWSKMRIAKGIHEHSLAPAISEVQELARLCLTAERFPAQLAGVAMLRHASRAAEREAPELVGRTVDKESTDRMLRVIAAVPGFARLETPASYEGTSTGSSWDGALHCTMGSEPRSWCVRSYAKLELPITSTWSVSWQPHRSAALPQFVSDGPVPIRSERQSRSTGGTTCCCVGTASSCSRSQSRTGSAHTRRRPRSRSGRHR
jgi:hypothetical protein